MTDTIAELESKLADAKAEHQAEISKRHLYLVALRKEFLATQPYVYTVSAHKSATFFGSNPGVPVKDEVYISRHIDIKAYEAFIDRHFEDIFHEDELVKREGMKYYLTLDGIIHYSGGGRVILNTPTLCSDAEWAQIQASNIPAKFLKGATQ
jgi:hypothetical protein